MIGKLLGIFGSKWGMIGLAVAAITIAGLVGYIRLQSAQHASEEIALRSRLKDLRKDVQDRDTVIRTQEEDKALFDSRLAEINSAMQGMQGQIAANSQQRRSDYNTMTRPRPAPGTPANTLDLENAANNGMNGIFNQMEADSKPAPLNDEGTAK